MQLMVGKFIVKLKFGEERSPEESTKRSIAPTAISREKLAGFWDSTDFPPMLSLAG
jgi:hypothetical protein